MPSPHLPSMLQLFTHMADAVYLLDPDTSTILWGNRAAWHSLGLAEDEVLNHSVLSLQKDVTGAPQWSEIAAVIRAAQCYTFVGRHRHAEGHEVSVEVNTIWLQDENGRKYFSFLRIIIFPLSIDLQWRSDNGGRRADRLAMQNFLPFRIALRYDCRNFTGVRLEALLILPAR